MYALAHEAGELVFEIPGVEVLNGARLYVLPDDQLERVEYDVEDRRASGAAPEGWIAVSEGW
ncbi:MAG: hypothetical protein M3P96_03555 [Actinomycetota bacterium]|nr:hypothetical protein [Actinomycetota bacterium]